MKRILFILIALVFLSCGKGREHSERLDQLNTKGVQLMNRQDYEGALIAFREARQYTEADAELQANLCRNLAIVFGFMDQKDSMLFYLQEGVQKAEKESYTWYLNKAELALEKGNVQEGLMNLDKARARKGDKMEVYNDYAMVYMGKYGEDYVDYDKAYTNSKKAYEIGKNATLKEMLATCAMNAEHLEESEKLFSELAEEFPANMYYKFEKGAALYFLGKEEEGEELMAYAAARDENCRAYYEQFFGE